MVVCHIVSHVWDHFCPLGCLVLLAQTWIVDVDDVELEYTADEQENGIADQQSRAQTRIQGPMVVMKQTDGGQQTQKQKYDGVEQTT